MESKSLYPKLRHRLDDITWKTDRRIVVEDRISPFTSSLPYHRLASLGTLVNRRNIGARNSTGCQKMDRLQAVCHLPSQHETQTFSARFQSYRVVTTGLEAGVHHGGSVTSNCPRFAPGGHRIEPRWTRGAKNCCWQGIFDFQPGLIHARPRAV